MSRRSAKAIVTLAPTLLALAIAQAFAASPAIDALPSGGRVVAGSAAIAQSGTRMDITQGSSRAILEWQSFNIGSGAQVNFAQPNAAAVALNRVLAGEASQIMGKLSANGQVFLINPAGIVFGAGSRVDVGGLVASSLDIGNDDFLAGRLSFAGKGGAVINRGTLAAANGGYVALLAPEVRNEGVISARLGSVALGAGEKIALDFGGDGLLTLAVDKGAVGALIDSRQLIEADGGQVLMSARAADELAGGIINHSGTVRARTLENRAGRILLLGDMTHGAVDFTGTLDASAPAGGLGGFVETSAAKVGAGETARVNTLATDGRHGTWLIDPNDYTIAASGGNISGTTLAANLAGGNVTISTATQGTAGGNGDIFVNDAIGWNANTVLRLQAERNIRINAGITATGNTAGLTLGHGSGRDYYVGAPITLSGSAPVLKIGVAGSEATYIVINTLGVAGDIGTTTLQGIKNNAFFGKYALGSDIDASATAGWNGGAGFTPIAQQTYAYFYGTFAGLGHTITGLTINRPTSDNVGLFGQNNGTIRDVGLVNAHIAGRNYVGALVGVNMARIDNSYSTATVNGSSEVGGLVGRNTTNGSNSFVVDSYSAATVNGSSRVGGLVGYLFDGTITNSHYDVDQVVINGGPMLTLGGLYHNQYLDWINNGKSLSIANYAATLPIAGGYYLISSIQGLKDMLAFSRNPAYKFRLANNLDLASAPGLFIPYLAAQEFDGAEHTIANLSLSQPNDGVGFVGYLGQGSRLTGLGIVGGNVNGQHDVGGLAGSSTGTVDNSYSTATVNGVDRVGGLIGYNSGTVSNSYSSATVTGDKSTGGLIGYNNGTVSNSYSAATVTNRFAGTNGIAGGLIAINFGMVSNSYSAATVTANGSAGGLIGLNDSGCTVSNSYSTARVTANGRAGGLFAFNYEDAVDSYWNTQNTSTSGNSISINNGTGLTTAQMQQQASFPGWDFTNLWRIYEGQSFPVLRFFQIPLTVTANDASQTYNGLPYSGGNGVTYSIAGATPAGTLDYAGTSQNAITAGSYSIQPAGLVSDQRYHLSYIDGTLTISGGANLPMLETREVPVATSLSQGEVLMLDIRSDFIKLPTARADEDASRR